LNPFLKEVPSGMPLLNLISSEIMDGKAKRHSRGKELEEHRDELERRSARGDDQRKFPQGTQKDERKPNPQNPIIRFPTSQHI
jgi:hypothetical protein